MADETSKKYPKTLSAPVDVETWEWFTAQADALDRTVGAQLRRVILAHRKQHEIANRFAGAVAVPITPDQAANAQVYQGHPVPPGEVHVNDPVPFDEDPEEGVT